MKLISTVKDTHISHVCCDKFKKAVDDVIIERFDEYYVNGCGGCFVLQEIKFCPFCGEKIVEAADHEEN